MTRNEFLIELENSLEGRLAEDEITEILNDYNEIFESSILDGKTEEITASELGSPAKIARKILDEAPLFTEKSQTRLQDNKIHRDTKNLASLSSRFGAYVIDTLLGALIILVIIFVSHIPFSTKDMVTWSETRGGQGYEAKFYKDAAGQTKVVEVLDLSHKSVFKGSTEEFSNFLDSKGISYPENFNMREYVTTVKTPLPLRIRTLAVLAALLAGNLFNSVITWRYKGYTVGKRLFKIKVEKVDGSRISFMDAVLRE